ncbi:MAG TPA: alpha/beta fold hydrolase [Chitinophaga sp.]|uniref:alpha/beta hydrolase n=1 Tax=Chitinophaga sp. TaxID=1869181 RepID=UPI002C28FC4D|nr:alpha/beta fold hydrolase [Chitinophaga sp.]HVI44336.1 alpha/beta fold hydrolase [Chitinophaga sp.]
MQQQVLPLSLKMTAALLSGMSRPFPELTARLFYRMYCTPPGQKMRPTHLQLKDAAQVRQLDVTSYAFDSRPVSITTYRWGKSDRKILVVHGWGGSPLHFKQLVQLLVSAGFEVVSYDAPAHGTSGGRRTNLVQWMHVFEQVMRQEGELYGVVAHSLGGLSAALALARMDLHVPRLVMVSSALSAPAIFDEAFRLFHIHPVVMPHLKGLIRERLQAEMEEMDLHLYINKIQAGRIFIAYDTTDQLVDSRQIDAYLEQAPDIKSLRITGEGHFRIMRQKAVLDGILSFLGAVAVK